MKKRSSRHRYFLIAVFTFFGSFSPSPAQVAIKSPEKDVPGSKDSRLLSRIEGSYIAYYKKTPLDDMKIPLDRITFDYEKQKLNDFRTRLVHGMHETFIYVLPGDISTSRAIQTCGRELRNHGVIEILFHGSKRQNELDDGYDRFVTEIYHMDFDDPATTFMRRGGDTCYLATRLPRPEGEFFITLLATIGAEGNDETLVPKGRIGMRVDILETKPGTESEDPTE